MGVSENIKRLRLQRGWTQEQLAQKLNVTRATVTQWESGWSQPRMGNVEKAALIFGKSVSELVAETSELDEICNLDNEQEELLGYFDSMNDTGRKTLLDTARLMSGSPETRFEKNREKSLHAETGLGA